MPSSFYPETSFVHKYSPALAPRLPRSSHPLITFIFRYLLLVLNVAFIVWSFIMTYAYVHPTSLPTSYPLRSSGSRQFRLLYVFHILTSLVLGGVNLVILYSAFAHDKARRKHWIRNYLCNCHLGPRLRITGAVFGLIIVAIYPGLIASAVRDFAARSAFQNACGGYALMAEIEVLKDFPAFNGSSSAPVFDASSTIRFYKRGRKQYIMDLIKAYNSTSGWDQSQSPEPGPEMAESFAKNSWSLWTNGKFEMVLRAEQTRNEKPSYFNVSGIVEDQLRGTNKTGSIPGPIASIKFDIVKALYEVTFTNTTAPGFPATTTSGNFSAAPSMLAFPALGLQQSNTDLPWRFLDRVCLPPKVRMRDKFRTVEDVVGDVSYNCRLFRICGLKEGSMSNNKWWWSWMEDQWPVVIGPIAWEFEDYSRCCRRGE